MISALSNIPEKDVVYVPKATHGSKFTIWSNAHPVCKTLVQVNDLSELALATLNVHLSHIRSCRILCNVHFSHWMIVKIIVPHKVSS
jgi:hypothetical protein